MEWHVAMLRKTFFHERERKREREEGRETRQHQYL
jgi:hypothetical protein